MKLEDFKNVIFGMSFKDDGKMNFNSSDLKEERDAIWNNRIIFFSKLDINIKNTVAVNLIHGNNVYVADHKDGGLLIESTDALIANKLDLFLTVTVSDCVPIYFYDYKNKSIGIAHAGWRGVVGNISNKTISKMITNFNTNPEDLIVFIGAHIKKCCFEIKDDVVDNFKNYNEFIIERNNIKTVDLAGIIKKQLMDLGVKDENITISEECTYCGDNKLASFRRDKPEKPSSMVAYIGLK